MPKDYLDLQPCDFGSTTYVTTFASLLIEDGQPLAYVKEQLGQHNQDDCGCVWSLDSGHQPGSCEPPPCCWHGRWNAVKSFSHHPHPDTEDEFFL